MARHIPCTLACLDHVDATETNILEPQLMQLVQSSIFHTDLRSIHIPLQSHRHGVDYGFCSLGRHPCLVLAVVLVQLSGLAGLV